MIILTSHKNTVENGSFTFHEPAKVEWHLMVQCLKDFFFYIFMDFISVLPQPCEEAQGGLVEMDDPQQLKELLHAHLGRNHCDLYPINVLPLSDSVGISDDQMRNRGWAEIYGARHKDSNEDGSSSQPSA
ncbi:unnamed protein product [Urochloa humidicola]